MSQYPPILLITSLLLLLTHSLSASSQHWTQADITSNLATKDAFIMFYAPWCGHCKNLKPTFETVAPGANVNLAQIDCTTNQQLCQKLKIRGYPTMLYFHNNKAYEYSGARTKDAIEAFINEGWINAAPVDVPELNFGEDANEDGAESDESKVITLTQKNISLINTTGGKWILEFYAPWCGFCQRYAPTYEKIARKVKYNVAKINCDEEKAICRMFDIKGFPTLKLVENGRVYTIPEREMDPLIEFAESNKDAEESTEMPQFDMYSTIMRELQSGINEIYTDFEELQRYKKGVIAVIVAVTGILTSLLTSVVWMCLFCLCGGSSGKDKKRKNE